MQMSDEGSEKAEDFPVYLPQKRKLPADHELFALGNAERELLAKQATLQVGLVPAHPMLTRP